MSTESSSHRQANQSQPNAWVYIRRALNLRCPECGQSPMFVPLKSVRSIYDWMTPLDGCPRCGYAYLREEGYFLLATWGVNYGIVAGLGLFISMMFEWLHPLKFWQYMVYIFLPLTMLSFLLVRHAKALFLAMDHFFDPHVKRP
ncbi:MAG TPA: DUF983 domain-containing protein [Tepidisphaeraceae bacterium]|nr:DUF983 domain-containing protein [Tepidisphaeraceae bacterium]